MFFCGRTYSKHTYALVTECSVLMLILCTWRFFKGMDTSSREITDMEIAIPYHWEWGEGEWLGVRLLLKQIICSLRLEANSSLFRVAASFEEI